MKRSKEYYWNDPDLGKHRRNFHVTNMLYLKIQSVFLSHHYSPITKFNKFMLVKTTIAVYSENNIHPYAHFLSEIYRL